jgi:hypothetical protein
MTRIIKRTGKEESSMSECNMYPDIWSDPDKAESDDEKKKIAQENAQHERLYRATREVMISSFGLDSGFPEEPKSFSEAAEAERINFLAVYGILLADNWVDPSLGRIERLEGEKVVKYKVKLPDGKVEKVADRSVVIAAKFADAVVAAVQEYTRNTLMYKKVFEMMASAESGLKPRPAVTSSPSVAKST